MYYDSMFSLIFYNIIEITYNPTIDGWLKFMYFETVHSVWEN